MEFGLELSVRYAATFVFFLVAVQAIRHLYRHRDAQSLYFALFFATLAVSAALIEIARLDGVAMGPENRLFGLAIAAHPYLLMLLISTMRPVARLAIVAGALLLAVSIVLIAFAGDSTAPPRISTPFILPLTYFIAMQAWGADIFWRQARESQGVLRNRYLFIVAGLLLLPAMVALHLMYITIPDQRPTVDLLYTVVQALTAGAYFIGFEPPPFVRRGWQTTQINSYQSEIIGTLINKPADRILHHLAEFSLRAVGGQDAIILNYDRVEQRLSMSSADESLGFRVLHDDLDGLGQLIAEFDSAPRYIRRRDLSDDGAGANILDGFSAGAMFSVPVVDLPASTTVLMITLRSGTLFVEEDLAILRSFARQARTILENNTLIAETQGLVEELRDETGDLEAMVLQREQALRESEDELRRRLVQLSALYRELESFSYSVSHDLRGPLRAIIGFSDALNEDYGDALPDEAREFLRRIDANSRKMGELMNSMLRLAKLSRSEVRTADVDLTETAVRVTHELRAQHPAHDVQFRVDPGMTVRGDPELINVMLTNMLGNAWKFTREAQPATVAFSATTVDGEKAYVVSDNGAGFDMSYADKLFKPFQRLHTAEQFEGSGIGLAIVQRIVNRHGGRVWAESRPGEGARFYFTLPSRERSPL